MNTFVNIFEFTKFRKFLAEYQERRQAAEPSFSRTEFCNLLGLPNTRSYFNDVVQGKRVTDNMRERFINVSGSRGTRRGISRRWSILTRGRLPRCAKRRSMP